MCLATPLKVEKVEDGFAFVREKGKKFKVSTQLLSGVKVGDWILAHDKLAIGILPESEAKVILGLIEEADHCHCKTNENLKN